jgi:hypothetical protein
MHRILFAVCASLVSASAFAGALDVSAPASAQTIAALSPVAGKVYPPLPTLAMLPASSNDDDEAPVSKTIAKKGKKSTRRVVDCKCNNPEPRLVVSDDSRVYLKDIESRLDAALAR